MSQFVAMHLTPQLQTLDKVDAWHWKMASSLQENFIMHLNLKKVKFPRSMKGKKSIKHC
jgi:hypothetical protein